MSPTQNNAVIWPTLAYADAPAAINFLVEAFGFEQRAAYPGETEGTISHAELRWPGGGGIMLGTANRAESLLREQPAGVGSVYIVTDDVDALFARAKSAGAKVLHEPVDQDYGSREFAVADPEGVIWSFGTYAGA
jgi:uncharacterized glyoxalase superfamily protein PhnB